MRIGGIYNPNSLLGSFLVGDGFFLSHFNDPLPVAVLLRTGGANGATGAVIDRTPQGVPQPQDPDAGPVQEVAAEPGQPAAGPGLRPVGPGRGHRPDRHRQHLDAVGVRAHPRDRAAAGGGDEASPDPGHDPLRGGHPVGLRGPHRRGDRDRPWDGVRRLPQATGHHRHRRSRDQPGGVRGAVGACSDCWRPPGPPVGPPSSTCWRPSPPTDTAARRSASGGQRNGPRAGTTSERVAPPGAVPGPRCGRDGQPGPTPRPGAGRSGPGPRDGG